MPIRPEFRKFYGRIWRTETRPRILARAGNKCEQCGARNGATIARCRGSEHPGYWCDPDERRWYTPSGEHIEADLPTLREWRFITVVLTIAHLNHTPGDDRDANLRALCQWCHLHFDQLHHHETRATRKDSGRPLLAAGGSM